MMTYDLHDADTNEYLGEATPEARKASEANNIILVDLTDGSVVVAGSWVARNVETVRKVYVI